MHHIVNLSDSDLVKLEPSSSLKVFLPYATKNNITNKALYRSHECYVHHELHKKIISALHEFQKIDIGLLMWDGYRHPKAQEMLFNIFPDQTFVTKPYDCITGKYGSHHSRGVAIDLTLIDSSGRELVMPTAFDNFSERAHADYNGNNITLESKANRKILRDILDDAGLVHCPEEWWEFTLPNPEKFPILFVPELEP